MATDRRLTLVINPDITKFTEALDALMSGVKQTTDQYTARWIEQAWTRPLAQSRACFMRDTHQLETDDGAIAVGLVYMRRGELPTALAVLVEREKVKAKRAKLKERHRRVLSALIGVELQNTFPEA